MQHQRKNVVRSYTLILRYSLWAQHYSRLYSLFTLYFSDLGQIRADLRSSHPTVPSGALCRDLILSGAAPSLTMFLPYRSGMKQQCLGLLMGRPTTGRMVCHWLLCPESLGSPSEGTQLSLILGIFMVNKDEYDLISVGFPKYFLGILYSNLIS